jgi:DNA polymerase-3 subunit epsilon
MATSWPEPPPLFDLDELDAGAPAYEPAPAPGTASASVQAPQPGRWFDRLGVFDLETTGVEVAHDRIVTASVGLLAADGSVIREQRWIADPGIEIPAGAAAVHGITTEQARAQGRPAAEVVAEVVAALRDVFADGAAVVAYNAPFDFSLLKHEAIRHGVEPIADPSPVFDPLVVDKSYDRFRKGKRTLETVAAHYEVALDAAHDATADAVAAGRVALALAERYADRLPDTADAFHAEQVGWAREQADGLTEYFVRIGRISPDDPVDGSWPIR